jgi:hypothetical protein
MAKSWIETWGKTCEKPKVKPEIAETFNWSKEERQKLNESVLIENIRKKLIAKYPEQKCFFETAIIKVMELWNNYEDYQNVRNELSTNIFLIFWLDGKLLAYLDEEWNKILDVSSIKPTDNENDPIWLNRINQYYIRKNNQEQRLELFKDGKIYKEWSAEFNQYILLFYIYWKLPKKSR